MPSRNFHRRRAKRRERYVADKVAHYERTQAPLAPRERERYEQLWRIEWDFENPANPVHTPDLAPLTSTITIGTDDE